MIKEHTLNPNMICFGELLWDNLPSGRKAGGAPMNVAYHLNRTGAESQLISCTGDDEAGRELVAFSADIGLPTTFLQTDPSHPTGEVIGKVMDNHEMVYDIRSDAAWDFISFTPELEQLVSSADAFIFGSLAARNDISRNTLLKLLDAAKFRVLDINLRAPHYTKEILELLLSKADLLKMNDDELVLLTEWFYEAGAAEPESIHFLQQRFSIKEIIVTKGGDGAAFYSGNESYSGKAYPITVADTVGAGDSFLAAFLYKKFTGSPIPETLDYALAMGAFIAGKSGACPPYSLADLDSFIHQHQP